MLINPVLRSVRESSTTRAKSVLPSQQTKLLKFPKTNLPSTKNLTLLIKPRKNVKEGDENLPIEIVAVGGKVCRSPTREWQLPPAYPKQKVPEYHTDKNFSNYFLQHNRRLGEMIKKVEMY